MSLFSAYCILLLDYEDKLPIKNIKMADNLYFSIITKDELNFPSFLSRNYGLIEWRYDENSWVPIDETGNPIFNLISAMRLVNHDVRKLFVDAIYDYNHD